MAAIRPCDQTAGAGLDRRLIDHAHQLAFDRRADLHVGLEGLDELALLSRPLPTRQ